MVENTLYSNPDAVTAGQLLSRAWQRETKLLLVVKSTRENSLFKEIATGIDYCTRYPVKGGYIPILLVFRSLLPYRLNAACSHPVDYRSSSVYKRPCQSITGAAEWVMVKQQSSMTEHQYPGG